MSTPTLYSVEIDGKPTNWRVKALTNPPDDAWAVGARNNSGIVLLSPAFDSPQAAIQWFFRGTEVSGLTTHPPAPPSAAADALGCYRKATMNVTRAKKCFCHTCNKAYHYLGINRHRAMHRDRRQDCKITYGYIIIGDKKILILCRQKRFSRQFKIRASGKDGNRFTDEEKFFENAPDELERLENGTVIEL